MKRDILAELDSPARLSALRGVKAGLDPACILNPCKLIACCLPARRLRTIAPLRRSARVNKALYPFRPRPRDITGVETWPLCPHQIGRASCRERVCQYV